MTIFLKLSKKYLASELLFLQILGALLKKWWLVALIGMCFAPLLFPDFSAINEYACYQILLLTLCLWLALSVCRSLTDIFNLRKKETGITWCQITMLLAIGVWIIGFLIILNLQKDSRYFIAFSIVGTLMAWVFQDNIKGAVTFIHLRLNNLLCIDDWIVVPKYNVDGMITRVTLTTVTVYNWDTTTSCFPTSTLYTDLFVNRQKMTEGKTYGRQMITSFILDTGWFHPLSHAETEQLKLKMKEDSDFKYLPEKEIVEGELNAKLYRIYLYHWMMNHPHVSRMPRLVVRWLQQQESGMPLQIYAFITEGSLAAFEWQHSQIIEHVLASLEWFGLQLYQSPSGFDTSNGNIHLTDSHVNYRKETME